MWPSPTHPLVHDHPDLASILTLTLRLAALLLLLAALLFPFAACSLWSSSNDAHRPEELANGAQVEERDQLPQDAYVILGGDVHWHDVALRNVSVRLVVADDDAVEWLVASS